MNNNPKSLRQQITEINDNIRSFISWSVTNSNPGFMGKSAEKNIRDLVFFCKVCSEQCINLWLRDKKITKDNSLLYAPSIDDITNIANDDHTPPVAKMHAKKIVQGLRSLSSVASNQHTNVQPLNVEDVDSREIIFSRSVTPINDTNLPALAEYDLDGEGSCLTKPFRLFVGLIFS